VCTTYAHISKTALIGDTYVSSHCASDGMQLGIAQWILEPALDLHAEQLVHLRFAH
jgi:hypothetical protein